MTIAARLQDLGIELPKAAAPVASYRPLVVSGDMVFVSGQLPFVDGELVTGKLGDTVDLETGQTAARACGLMMLARTLRRWTVSLASKGRALVRTAPASTAIVVKR